jgi:hypothetical protein
LRISPDPNPEEIAAIMAALAVVSGGREEPEEVAAQRCRSRWRLAGLLGHAPPREMKLEGSLWSYSSWEGMV